MSRFAILRTIQARFRPTDGSANYIQLQSPGSVASNVTITLPGTLPTATEALTISSTGVMGTTPLSGGGSVTSVALTAPAPFTVSGSPITAAGTLALTLASQTANTFFAAPNGSAGAPTMRAIAWGDVSALAGSSGTSFAVGNDARLHNQNTDTGTTQTSFQLNSGASGVRLVDSSGALQVRNAANSANADLTAANLTVSGNLTVQGTTTTINSETLTVDDNIIILNNNVSTGTPTENAGIEVRRGGSANAQVLWDETADAWFIGTVGGLRRLRVAAEQTFVNADLTSGVFTWTHNLGVQYFPVVAVDNNDEQVQPRIVYTSTTQLTADFSGFGTLSGTWRLVA